MHVVLSILLTFLFAFSAQAQDPDKIDPPGPPYEKSDKQFKNAPLGFEMGFYSGYGWNSRGCSQCYPEQWTGGWQFGAKAGARLSKRFAADLIVHFWKPGSDLWKPDDKIEYMRMVGFLHAAGYYYPFSDPFFFLKVSAGYTVFHFTPSEPVNLDNGIPMRGTLSHDGLGLGFGIGYAVMISKTLDLTPAIDYLYQPFSQLKGWVPNQVVSGAEGSQSIYLSLGLNFHPQAVSLTERKTK